MAEQELMKFYEAFALVESAKKMTANPQFDQLKALLKECQTLVKLGDDVFAAFPHCDDDRYYNSNPQNLQEKVAKRLSVTKQFQHQLSKMDAR